MAKVKIDEAAIHQLLAGAFEGATNIPDLVRRQLGEEEIDGASLIAVHGELTITPQRRKRGADEPDFADVEAVFQIKSGEAEEAASPAAIMTAAAEVAAAVDEYTMLDAGGSTHQLDLGRAVVKAHGGDPLAGAAGATVTVSGTCQRVTGNTRLDFTS